MKVKVSEKSRILVTKDYSMFSYSDFRLRQNTVRSLVEDISEKNLNKDMPVIVDEEYNIIDRRHVFVALKQLGLPVHYKVAEVAERLDFLKAKKYDKKATLFDFMVYHKEKFSYRKLLEFRKLSGLSYSEIFVGMLGIKTMRSTEGKDFQNGVFALDEYHIKMMDEIIQGKELLSEFGLSCEDHEGYIFEQPIDVVRGILSKYKDVIDAYLVVYSSEIETGKGDRLGIAKEIVMFFYDQKIAYKNDFDSWSLRPNLLYGLRACGRWSEVFMGLQVSLEEFKKTMDESKRNWLRNPDTRNFGDHPYFKFKRYYETVSGAQKESLLFAQENPDELAKHLKSQEKLKTK